MKLRHLGLVLFLLPLCGQGADVRFCNALKSRHFDQTGPAIVKPNANCPFLFQAQVLPSAAGTVGSAAVIYPSGLEHGIGYSIDDGFILHSDCEMTLPDLNGKFPNGIYKIRVSTTHDGTKTVTLNLIGDGYPAIPQIKNFTETQMVNPNAAFTVEWFPLDGGSPNDFIQLRVSTSPNGRLLFSTPLLDEPGALNGKSTLATIPARTFAQSTAYFAELLVARPVSADETGYPGVRALGGYSISTVFALKTASQPTITLPPVSQIVAQDSDVTLTVQAVGSAPLSYQWRKGGSNILGAISSTLAIYDVAPSDAGRYSVAVSNPVGTIMSVDAILTVNLELPMVWKRRDIPLAPGYSISRVAYGDGHYLAVSDWGRFGSTNAVEWSPLNLPLGVSFENLCFLQGRFIAGIAPAGIMVSYDSVSWDRTYAKTNLLNGSYLGLWTIAQNPQGLLVAGGGAPGFPLLLYSRDTGLSWSEATIQKGAEPIAGIAYGNGRFIAVRQDGSYVSEDGVVWTTVTNTPGPGVNAVAFGDGKFVAVTSIYVEGVGLSPSIQTSLDGLEWTRCALPLQLPGRFSGLAFGCGLFIAAGSSPGVVLSSTNGTDWSTVFSDPMFGIENVTLANDRFFVAGYDGTTGRGALLLSPPLSGAASATGLPRIESIQASANARAVLRCLPLPGRLQGIQASDDLIRWTTVSTITNATGPVTFTDPLPMASRRFYRIGYP
jgi:hypothetical protein